MITRYFRIYIIVLAWFFCSSVRAMSPVDYVSTLVGTDSNYSLSSGNTYPAVAMPWGMNFWVAQTGKMGDGWQYTYSANKIRGSILFIKFEPLFIL